jgi:ABC-type branched-subunit amino acid transport system substrate-binding protein
MERQKEIGKLSEASFVKAARIVCIGLIALIFLLNAPSAMAQKVFKIGVDLPLTGVFAREAEDIKLGAIMAADEWNAKGGVLGRKVELVIRDDQLNPAEAARKVKEMVENEGVKFVAGALSAAVAMAIHNYTKRVGVLYMCLTIRMTLLKYLITVNTLFHDMANTYMYTQTLVTIS